MQHFKSYFSNMLLLEYSDAFVQKLATKLAAGNEAMVEDIKRFIRFFDTVRNRNNFLQYVKDNPNLFLRGGRPITDARNVDMYSASQLEHIFDHFSTDTGSTKAKDDDQLPITHDADLIYPKNVSETIRELNPAAKNDPRYLEVYFAGNREKCVKFSHDTFNYSYTFCVGRKDTSNMYSRYRLGTNSGGRPSSFYFVRDYSLPHSNENHLLVIQKNNDGSYVVTKAPNNGDNHLTWDQIVALQPKLKGLESLFKFIPFSEQEEDQASIQARPDQFKTLSPRHRNAYILAGKKLLPSDFLSLTTEEQNNYITVFFNENMYVDNLFYNIAEMYMFPYFQGREAEFYSLQDVNKEIVEKSKETFADIGVELHPADHYYLSDKPDKALKKAIDVISILEINRYYAVSNNKLVKRDQERVQPLKLLIHKYTLNSLTGDNIQRLFDKEYPKPHNIIDRIYNHNESQARYTPHRHVGLIRLENNICIISTRSSYTERFKENSIKMVICDNFLKPIYKLINVIDITKNGFVIKTVGEEETKLLNFKNNNINIQDIDERAESEHSILNFEATYPEFAKLHKTKQAIRIEECINAIDEQTKTFLNPTYKGKYQGRYKDLNNEPRQYLSVSPIYFPSRHDEHSLEVFKNICDGYFSKEIQKNLLLEKNTLHDSEYISKHIIRDVAILYFLTKKYVPEKAEEVLLKGKKYLESLINGDYAIHYRSSVPLNVAQINNNKIFSFNRKFVGSIFDLNTLTYTVISEIVMFTKEQIAFGSLTKTGVKNVVCFNKETLEESDKSLSSRIEQNIKAISTAPDEKKVEMVGDLYINYYPNPALIKFLTDQPSSKDKKSKPAPAFTLPRYISGAKLKFNPKKDFILEIKSQEQRDQYNKLISFHRLFHAFLKTIDDIYDIKLRRVYFIHPNNPYNPDAYNVAYEYSHYENFSPTQLDTQFVIIIKNTKLYNNRFNMNDPKVDSPRLLSLDNEINNRIYKTDSSNVKWLFDRQERNVIIPSRASKKNRTMKDFLMILDQIYSGQVRTQESIDIVAKNILGTIPTLDMHIGLKQYFSELSKVAKVVEDSFLPFGIFYKLKL